MRVTWVQPEDLLPHEFVASREEGRAVDDVEARWIAAGGPPGPPVGGASAPAASGELRALAVELLAEIQRRPVPGNADEPDDLGSIAATWPHDGSAATWPHDGSAATWPQDGSAATRSRMMDVAASLDLPDRLHGAWLGRAVGCLLGKPVEKVPRAGIREILQATGRWPLSFYFSARDLPDEVSRRWPWNRASRPTSLVENIDGMPEDDDLNYPLIALRVLETAGHDFTSDDVAKMWLDLLPAGRVFTAERVAYANLLRGLDPPATARMHNPYRQWIGAQIRTELYGWANPGRPDRAARQAFADAQVSHVRNGVYGAIFAAALGAAAMVETDIDQVLDTAQAFVPPHSRYAAAVRFAREVAAAESDWEVIVDAIEARYRHLHWVHVLGNAALMTAALAYGKGDLVASICAVVSGGWDTDSTGATVGAVTGALSGAKALPAEWVEPLHNRLATSVPGFAETAGVRFDALAARTLGVLR